MLQDAAKHFELVVQGYTKRLGPEHPETVNAFDRLKRCQGDSNGAVQDDKNDSDDAASVGAVTLLPEAAIRTPATRAPCKLKISP